MKTFRSSISDQDFPLTDLVPGQTIRRPLLDYIRKEHPQLANDCSLSISEVNYYRQKYIADTLVSEIGDLGELQKKVADSLATNTLITDKELHQEEQSFTMGQKIADRVAAFGGSWTFILAFLFFIFAWIAANVFWYTNRGFDPYPFILLNLLLSCVAALQAPVIMMSQNRQEEKDRERAKQDYMINLKSELEIRMLHEKIDHLIMHQQQELLVIQQVQIDMMNDIIKRIEKHYT